MSPTPVLQRIDQIRRRLALPRERIQRMLPPKAWTWIWRGFQLLSLLLVSVGLFYAWREFPGDVQISPGPLALAGGIYLITFSMHLLGWHQLAQIFLGHRSLRDNVAAVAGSNLVKYLPTVAWYIAKRGHFYAERGVSQRSVVTASLCELALMVGAGGLLLLGVWLGGLAGAPALGLGGLALFGLLSAALGRRSSGSPALWLRASMLYGGTWVLGGLFLWAVMGAFTPMALADLPTVATIWLAAGLASYAVSLTLGTIGIAREITLTVLLAQHWPLAVGIAAAVAVKILLTLGELACSLLIIGWLQLRRRGPAPHE